MAHALNLLLQDQDSPCWIHFVVEDAQKIIKFIRLHHVFLALFYKHVAILAQRWSLLNPGTTQFSTNFFMVARLFDMKEALKQTMIGIEWDVHQDLVEHAKEAHADASTRDEEVDTK